MSKEMVPTIHPVSYTHLDVYKRQHILYLGDVIIRFFSTGLEPKMAFRTPSNTLERSVLLYDIKKVTSDILNIATLR